MSIPSMHIQGLTIPKSFKIDSCFSLTQWNIDKEVMISCDGMPMLPLFSKSMIGGFGVIMPMLPLFTKSDG